MGSEMLNVDLLHIEGQHSGPSGYQLKPGYWRSTRAESPAGGMSPRGIHTLKQPYRVPPDQAVNGIAVIEAIVASEASGKPIKLK